MSTTLFFLVPIGMLAVVWTLCFVGVCFPTSGEAQAYSNYILQETSLVAYWPLSDLPNTPLPTGAPALPPPPTDSTGLGTAVDFKSNHNGTYLEPPAYVSGTTTPQIGNNPKLNLHQPSILPGDAFKPGSKNLPACVDFEGGYVSIPWAAGSPSLAEFTFEAWVQPKWNSAVFNWDVFSARTKMGTGFVIHINAINGQNHWVLNIGNGTELVVFDTNVEAAVAGSLTYVAVTFASTNGTTGTLSLWINPASDDTSTPPTANFTQTVTYAAIDQTEAVTFFIGAGDNEDAQTPRTQDGGAGAPLVPFQGLIQSVALYNSALQPTDLASHFADGAASDT
jgi:Concanavalin A-like lectin/glucanases superfamily